MNPLMTPHSAPKRRLWLTALIATLSLSSLSAWGLSQRKLKLSELVERSELIVEALVTEQRVIEREGPHRRPWIYTLSELEVRSCWRAPSKGCPSRVTVSQIGGTLAKAGDQGAPLTLTIPGIPLLKQGDEAAFFLRAKSEAAEGEMSYVIVGGAQGRHALADEAGYQQLKSLVQQLTQALQTRP